MTGKKCKYEKPNGEIVEGVFIGQFFGVEGPGCIISCDGKNVEFPFVRDKITFFKTETA